MRRICAYFTSLLVFILAGQYPAKGQDTLLIPLKVKIGIEAIGPVTYMIEKQTLSTEAYVSADLNEKWALALNFGRLDYDFTQYNYNYLCKGFFLKAGGDFNILKPKKSMGIYWGGISLRYGLSRFEWQVPELSQSNYWGKAYSSIAPNRNWGHFLEASPGMRAEIFRNFSMGWSVSLRMLLYTGKSDGIKPVYFPGFGNATKRFSTGFSYYIVWTIPYKKIKVITRKEEPEEDEDQDDQNRTQGSGTNSSSSGNRQQQSSPYNR
jgi:hypothetical protein